MTVLVLDNPELMARVATESGFLSASANLQTGHRKPHRSRFHYGFNQHRLDSEDLALVEKHAIYLRNNPAVRVHIHGHADNFGAEEYNLFLSRLRASAVAKQLVRGGASEAQIIISGWGSARPLMGPDDHSANRRLELQYLSDSPDRHSTAAGPQSQAAPAR